jgi:hypothetical protein
MHVSVERSKEEAQADGCWVRTRNGTVILYGVDIWASGMSQITDEFTKVYIDFIGSRGLLNAGAMIPIAWMDQLALEWCKKRNLSTRTILFGDPEPEKVDF